MKLRGKVLEKIPEEKQKEMQRTLDTMAKSRKEIDKRVTEKIDEKLNWALAEKEKGEGLIADYKQKIKVLEGQVLRIDGAIRVLKELKG
jgi:hypothetical protein